MRDPAPQIHPARWLVFGTFMFVNVVTQMLWICYAPIASAAAAAWGVKPEAVTMLPGLSMLLYLPVAIPAAWAIDYFGFKKAVGFGAILTGLFGLLRGLFPTSYTMALVGTVGIAVGQPFLLGAFTKLAALWFPKAHRATVTGFLFLGIFFGVGLGQAASPWLLETRQFADVQMIYGIAAAAACLLFLILAPSRPPGPADEARTLVLDGFRSILRQWEVYVLCLALFIGGGIVNSVITLIDGLGREKGFTSAQEVTLTILMLVAGVLGSIVFPVISDGLRRRKAIVMIGILLGVPATLGVAFGRGFLLEAACFFVLGFCLTGVTPVAYQYGAEVTHPVPEGTSNGVFALAVQASGLLILLVDALKGFFHGSYVPPLVGLAILLAASGLLFMAAAESPDMLAAKRGGS